MSALALSDALAGFVAETTYDALPSRAVTMTKWCLLDALGVSLAASQLGEGCKAFIDVGVAQGGNGPCTIFGTPHRTTAELAAFANGALAHALDYEDSHDGALVHPNAPTMPAALATAQAKGTTTGKELITALAIGCDVVVRLGLCLRTSLADFGWYPPPLLAAFGATAAASKLLQLNAAQIKDAFSLTLCQLTCTGEIIYSPQSTLRAVRDAFPARAGVSAPLLARAGVRGFETPLEGRAGFFATFARNEFDPRIALQDLGKRFEIEQISFKPWPSCRGTHAAIEAALQCRSAGIDSHQIEHVQVRGGRMLSMLSEPLARKRQPATAIDAKFSVPFTVATALAKGRVTLADFAPAALNDDAVLSVARKVDVQIDTARASTDIGATVEVITRDGARSSHRIDIPLGAPSRPLSPAALMGKFVDCAAAAAVPVMPKAALELAHCITELQDVGNIDTELLPLLSGAH